MGGFGRRRCRGGKLAGRIGVSAHSLESGTRRPRASRPEAPAASRETVAGGRDDRLAGQFLGQSERLEETAPTQHDAGEQLVEHGAEPTRVRPHPVTEHLGAGERRLGGHGSCSEPSCRQYPTVQPGVVQVA